MTGRSLAGNGLPGLLTIALPVDSGVCEQPPESRFVSDAERQRVRRELEEYCGQDTGG